MLAIKQEVTVQANGLIEIRSPELHEGDVAEVTVLIKAAVKESTDASKKPSWRDFIGYLGPGDHGSSDNAAIDRDLATSYLDKHEPK